MVRGGVDTRWWNLSLGVVAATGIGCGPQVVLYGDTEADTDSVDDTGPLPDTGIDPATDDGPQCSDANPCPDNQVCVDGICMGGYADEYSDEYSDEYLDYSDYADESYCYEYGPNGECCSYYECPEPCVEEEDCGIGQLCLPYDSESFCVEIPEVEACPLDPNVMLLPYPDVVGEVVSLAFVDADGDLQADLLVGADTGEVYFIGAATPPTPLTVSPGLMLDAASGDFNGDMIQDLVVSFDDGSLVMFHGDGLGEFFEAQTVAGFGQFSELETLNFNSDTALDLAVRNTGAAAFVLLNAGDGTLFEGFNLDTEGGIAYSISAGGNLFGDERDEVVVSRPLRDELFEGSDVTGTLQPTLTGELGPAHGERRIDVVDFNADGSATFIGLTQLSTWTLLEGVTNLPSRARISYPASRVGLGDHNNDEMPDVALVGANRLLWLTNLGEARQALPTCWGTVLLEYEPIAASVGDWNGDGFADVAVTDGADVTIVLTL